MYELPSLVLPTLWSFLFLLSVTTSFIIMHHRLTGLAIQVNKRKERKQPSILKIVCVVVERSIASGQEKWTSNETMFFLTIFFFNRAYHWSMAPSSSLLLALKVRITEIQLWRFWTALTTSDRSLIERILSRVLMSGHAHSRPLHQDNFLGNSGLLERCVIAPFAGCFFFFFFFFFFLPEDWPSFEGVILWVFKHVAICHPVVSMLCWTSSATLLMIVFMVTVGPQLLYAARSLLLKRMSSLRSHWTFSRVPWEHLMRVSFFFFWFDS